MADDNRKAVAEFIRTRGITRCPTAFVLPTQRCLVPLTGRRSKNMRRFGVDCSEHEPRLTGENWYISTAECRRHRSIARATATG